MTEILLKVVLNTINQPTNQPTNILTFDSVVKEFINICYCCNIAVKM